MKKVRSKLHPTEIGVIKTFSLSPKDEIGEIAVECTGSTYYYNSLAELCEKWEDYEEPKKTWFIDTYGSVRDREAMTLVVGWDEKPIFGFEAKEEAEKAAEKIKAITRLKSCGFKFKGWRTADLGADKYYFVITAESDGAGKGDLDLLFGGEE